MIDGATRAVMVRPPRVTRRGRRPAGPCPAGPVPRSVRVTERIVVDVMTFLSSERVFSHHRFDALLQRGQRCLGVGLALHNLLGEGSEGLPAVNGIQG